MNTKLIVYQYNNNNEIIINSLIDMSLFFKLKQCNKSAQSNRCD